MVPSLVKEPFQGEEKLWNLLGRTRKVEVPDRFAADVIRAIRMGEDGREDGREDWSWAFQWLVPSTAAAAVGICLALASLTAPGNPGTDLAVEFREAAELDSLVASSAGWAWHEVAP